MFFLALVYAVILIVWAVFYPWNTPNWRSGIAQIVLFAIIGFVLFFDVLNKH